MCVRFISMAFHQNDNTRIGAGVPLTSGQLYSAGHTDDLRQALMYISNMFPDAPLLGIGFSLGANVIVRYLAEEGVHSRLRAGCALGCVSGNYSLARHHIYVSFAITSLGIC